MHSSHFNHHHQILHSLPLLLTPLSNSAAIDVQFQTATLTITEGEPATISVVLSTQADREVSVDFTTVDGTATAPNDYGSLTFTLPFLVGRAAATINLNTVEDSTIEGIETFSVTLSNPTNGLTLGYQVVTVVTIQDDDKGKAIIDKGTFTNA